MQSRNSRVFLRFGTSQTCGYSDEVQLGSETRNVAWTGRGPTMLMRHAARKNRLIDVLSIEVVISIDPYLSRSVRPAEVRRETSSRRSTSGSHSRAA